ncbi:MAG: FAD-dependent oxidoreductase [Bacteriovoracaceae bacterium]|jgi:L-aspartate oxidase|nr:FAD-dependent oxidoreductase [Bacteriovoracaceae bacterium]
MNKFDCLIIGSGVSGLTSAIKLAENNLSVAIVTRADDPNNTNTNWAQGGIIYSDDKELVSDIDKASSHTSNITAAKIIEANSKDILTEVLLEKAKTDFDKDNDGNLLFTKEAAHTHKRIIYKGDYTGKQIQVSLLNYLKNHKNVTILTSHTAIDLITAEHHGISLKQRYEDNAVLGAYLLDQKSGKVRKIISKKTVLATGGIGALYLHNSNTDGARGDGHAMAKRAGAFVSNMEFIQFHPTTFYAGSFQRRFLISEALRGEGGILYNSKNEAFMQKYHKDKELAPRDVVARAIASEMIALKNDCVYLDITNKDSEWIKERFPTIYSYCQKKNIDITKQRIPVVPAAHYTCGGVKTDSFGKTNLKNLYAVGEVANTGLHGANRLASTSLLEGIVFGHRASESILDTISEQDFYDESKIREWINGDTEVDLGLITQDIQTIKQTMWNYLGLTRSKARLNRAKAMFSELSDEVQKFYKNAALHDELIGLRNAVEVAHMVLNSSIRNKKSIGCFYLSDS